MRRALATVLLLTPLAAEGCEPTDRSAPTTMADGARVIRENLVGRWNAPGGTACRWWMVRDGVITHPGNTTGPATARRQKPGRAADQSQTVIIGHGNVGDTFRSDKCGGWTR